MRAVGQGPMAIATALGISRISVHRAPTVGFALRAKGFNARIPPHAEALLAGAPEGGTVDAHGVQTYHTGLLARAAGMRISLSINGDEVRIRATADADQDRHVRAPAAPVSFGSMPHL